MYGLEFTKYIIQYTVGRNYLSINNLLESLVIIRDYTVTYLYFYTGGVANKIFYKITPYYIYIYSVTPGCKSNSGFYWYKFNLSI